MLQPQASSKAFADCAGNAPSCTAMKSPSSPLKHLVFKEFAELVGQACHGGVIVAPDFVEQLHTRDNSAQLLANISDSRQQQ
jgi:hypothetical protein